MEVIAKLKETEIESVLGPTAQAFAVPLEAKRQEIESVPKKTFKYGSTDRHQLDVYYPTAPHKSGKAPVVFYFYGGGLVSGARNLPAPVTLAYASIGLFFSQRGYFTVIPDYRLAPHVQDPAPVEDIRDAITWIVQNPELVTTNDAKPDYDQLFLFGHSAGALLTASLLLNPGLLGESPANILPRIRGLVLSGGAYHFEQKPTPLLDIFQGYYGSLEKLQAQAPLGLLKDASERIIKSLPDILMVEAEREPVSIRETGDLFQAELEKRTGKKIRREIGKGHNHISMALSLGSGEGEEWGKIVVEWLDSK